MKDDTCNEEMKRVNDLDIATVKKGNWKYAAMKAKLKLIKAGETEKRSSKGLATIARKA
jgi:hypothetical protein